MATYLGCEAISIIYPLVKCYRREKYLDLPEDTEDHLLDIGKSSLRDSLVAFLEERFSVQYLFFIEDVKLFKENPTLERAKEINAKFVQDEAEMNIEAEGDIVQEIEELIEKGDISGDLFNFARNFAEERLDGMMSDFYQSEEYGQWRKGQKKEQLHQGFSEVGITTN